MITVIMIVSPHWSWSRSHREWPRSPRFSLDAPSQLSCCASFYMKQLLEQLYSLNHCWIIERYKAPRLQYETWSTLLFTNLARSLGFGGLRSILLLWPNLLRRWRTFIILEVEWMACSIFTFMPDLSLKTIDTFDWGGASKKWYFLGIIPNQVDPPWIHLGIEMWLLAKKVRFSRPKTMATKISHRF